MRERSNILLIQTDAQHHSWLGFRGAPGLRTPHLDRLAEEHAVVFDHAYTCSGVCMPSRASLMTGRYTLGHGVVSNQVRRRAPGEPAIGRMLQNQGYTTGCFGKTHFGGDDNDMPGEGWSESFTVKQYKSYLKAKGVNARYPEKEKIDRLPARYWNFGGSRIPNEHYLENVITDRAAAFMDRHANESFMCYVSYIAPHCPFTPPRPYSELYNPADMVLAERFAGELDGKPPQTRRWIEQNAKYLNDDELRNWLAMIYGLLTMIDDNVGRLLKTLERNGLLDDTLIIFTSDHGDYATRHGVLGKSWSMSDDLLRIPLLIAVPGGQPKTSEALVQNIDLTATMLDWAGIDVPAKMHGRTLMPLLYDQTQRHRDQVFAYDQAEYSEDRLDLSMIRTSKWKYIQSTDFEGELYDLRNDPAETLNLVNDSRHRAVRDELRFHLLQWHVGYTGGYYDLAETDYWIDKTRFFDEHQFTGTPICNSGPH